MQFYNNYHLANFYDKEDKCSIIKNCTLINENNLFGVSTIGGSIFFLFFMNLD